MARELRRKNLTGDDHLADSLDPYLSFQTHADAGSDQAASLKAVAREAPAIATFRENGEAGVLDALSESDALPPFSLDEFDDLGDDTSNPSEVQPEQSGISPSGGPAAASGEKWLRGISGHKVLLLGLVPGVLLLITAAITATWFPSPVEPVRATKFVRHPIAVPHYREVFEFLILAEASHGKDILSLNIEFQIQGFSPSDATGSQILLRDKVYSFLKDQHPAKNTYSSWQKIVEKGLPAYLKDELPGSRIETISIKQLDRL